MYNDKPSLLLVDRRALHRERIKLRLDTLYSVTDFALLDEALRHARRAVPDGMVICEDQALGESFDFLQTMRLDPAFKTLPIVIVLAEENPAHATRALHAGADACVAKPYLPSVLAGMISGGMRKACERRWEALPNLEAAALKNSVAMFNGVADMIASGQSILYSDINAACQPLLETVGSNGIGNVLRAVRDHDNYAYAHSLRVAVFLSVFGRNIGLPAAEQAVLTTGGLLHDIGKTTIPALLLNKPGRLTNAEYDIMKGHVGATMVALEHCEGLPKGVLVIAGQHHEKLDGSGYPNALPGSKLNELARMAAIADIFSALTDRRVYKPAMTPDRAFALMADEMTTQLDMPLMRCFRQILYDTHIAQPQTEQAST
jgi:HD-GYP domain-containing protein (c-di-GMP phosphodiesterase class II)